MSANDSINRFCLFFQRKIIHSFTGGGEKYPYKVDNYVLTKHNHTIANALTHRDIKSKIEPKRQFAHCTTVKKSGEQEETKR